MPTRLNNPESNKEGIWQPRQKKQNVQQKQKKGKSAKIMQQGDQNSALPTKERNNS
jgi:hypothetical protein